MTRKTQLPVITQRKQVASSRFFAIEQIDLTFSNGVQREYERMQGSGRGAVMIVPLQEDGSILLVREYCAGTHSYELGFPKGLIDPGETAQVAANRELQEEIGFGAEILQPIHQVSMAPAFFNARMDIFLARGLYPQSLEGDEPEPLEVVSWPLDDFPALLAEPNFTEARSIAALLLVVNHLRG